MNEEKSKKVNNVFVPTIFSVTQQGYKSSDVFSELLDKRIVMLCDQVTDESMAVTAAQILLLNSKDSERPIFLYILSPGGSVLAGLGTLIDIMNYVKAPVYTVALGMAASMGGAILSAGEPGHRYAMKSSQILVHPMTSGTEGRTRDNVACINYDKRLNDYLYSTIAHNCHQMSDSSYTAIVNAVQAEGLDDRNEDQILKIPPKALKELNAFKKNNDYDHWMFPQEALRFGIIDKILYSEKELEDENQ